MTDCAKLPEWVFVMVRSGPRTVMLAVAVLPVPLLVEVTAPLVLVTKPWATAITFTENVHDELVAMVAPERLMVLEPAAAVMVPPPQEPLSPLGVATTRAAGRVSLKPTPVSADKLAAGFVMVKLKLVVAPSGIVPAPN